MDEEEASFEDEVARLADNCGSGATTARTTATSAANAPTQQRKDHSDDKSLLGQPKMKINEFWSPRSNS